MTVTCDRCGGEVTVTANVCARGGSPTATDLTVVRAFALALHKRSDQCTARVCQHCAQPIRWLSSPTPELGGDWWHVDDTGATTRMSCCDVGTSLEYAEP